jgi:hypothetical protein
LVPDLSFYHVKTVCSTTGGNMMDMRALKVGQKFYVHIYEYGDSHVYEATVEAMDGPTHGWGHVLVKEYVRIGIANWDGSYNGLARGSSIDFDYDGNEICSYGFSADGWDPRPVGIQKIVPCD